MVLHTTPKLSVYASFVMCSKRYGHSAGCICVWKKDLVTLGVYGKRMKVVVTDDINVYWAGECMYLHSCDCLHASVRVRVHVLCLCACMCTCACACVVFMCVYVYVCVCVRFNTLTEWRLINRRNMLRSHECMLHECMLRACMCLRAYA